MINPNIKKMLAELKREFPGVYEVPDNGLYVVISDGHGKTYEDEYTGFDEREIDEVSIFYQEDDITIYANYFGRCEIRTGAIECKNLEVTAKAIGIVGKYLKNIW